MSLQLLGKLLSEKIVFHPGKLFFIGKKRLHPNNVYSCDLSLTPETRSAEGLLDAALPASQLGSGRFHSKTLRLCLPFIYIYLSVYLFIYLLIILAGWVGQVACGILVPRPGIEPGPRQ